MELLPQALVVGVVTPPPGVPGGADVTPDKLNRIWSEIATTHGYRQYALAPDGSGAEFAGASPAEGITIQPPLIQLRDKITFTAAQSADQLETALKVIVRHLGIGQLFNLAVRHVYHAPVADNDARGFVMHRVLGKEEDDLGALQIGENFWGGAKYVSSAPDRQYTLVLEPLQSDERYVYVDLDAQFPGPTTPDAVTDRAKDAEQYLTGAVASYLDSV
jgi:hypothetical protein